MGLTQLGVFNLPVINSDHHRLSPSRQLEIKDEIKFELKNAFFWYLMSGKFVSRPVYELPPVDVEHYGEELGLARFDLK